MIVNGSVSWGDKIMAAIAACRVTQKSEGSVSDALKKFNATQAKPVPPAAFNGILKSAIQKAEWVLNGGEKTVHQKNELGEIQSELSVTTIYTASTDKEERAIAQLVLNTAKAYYSKKSRGRKSLTTAEMAKIMMSAFADDEETEEQNENAMEAGEESAETSTEETETVTAE